MGLALVKRIVVQYHGGRISVASTNRHGTTFQVLLPPAAGHPETGHDMKMIGSDPE
jgi:signal transduction histidine kinase